jgi:hypothetical protein
MAYDENLNGNEPASAAAGPNYDAARSEWLPKIEEWRSKHPAVTVTTDTIFRNVLSDWSGDADWTRGCEHPGEALDRALANVEYFLSEKVHCGRAANPDKTIANGDDWIHANRVGWCFSNVPPCGMIFEFKAMAQAEAFAAEVKRRFGLDGRVFDDAEAAAKSHMFPWEQYPPVAHIDRPWWGIKDTDTPEGKRAWDEAWKLELRIEKLAKKFGGRFVGT